MTDRQAWTDGRLDDLNGRVGELNQQMQAMNGRIDGLQQTMIHAFVAMTVAMVAGFVGLAGLIVAQT